MSTSTLTNCTKHKMDYILTFEVVPGWLGRLFGAETKAKKYIGSGTVWRHFPNFDRCATWRESILVDSLDWWLYHRGEPELSKD